MQIQSIQNYNFKPIKNNQQKRQHNVSFGGTPTYSNKGCGFLMALSLATVIGAISAPIATYNYLSENQKENGKVVNLLTSIGAGITAFGMGTGAMFRVYKKYDPPKDV